MVHAWLHIVQSQCVTILGAHTSDHATVGHHVGWTSVRHRKNAMSAAAAGNASGDTSPPATLL